MKNFKLMLLFVVTLLFSAQSYSQSQITHVGVVIQVEPHYQTLVTNRLIYDCEDSNLNEDQHPCEEWREQATKYRDGWMVTYNILGQDLKQFTSKEFQVGEEYPVLLVVLPF